MAGIFDENSAKVIKQNDPEIPDYLDFDKLRKEGLEHIGQLAGKVWTDHNVHDPGITILEVLIYAIMDLGYKTNLPFRDLISLKDQLPKDDNFLTPREILSINPVTILDYRKLLLESPDVRNVWIEPAEQEIKLSIASGNNTLNCGQNNDRPIQDCNNNPISGTISLNGLYKIYIEKENKEKDDEEIINDVRKMWSQYRNLCEDLIDVTILESLELGVCAEVELIAGADSAKIYKAILVAIRQFIQPQINYYTLSELLEKGRTMDEIFAGRPFRDESFGFVDTVEFEALKRRKAIYLSDLYHVILSIDGVRKIKSIKIQGGALINQPSYQWVEGNVIQDVQIPVFSLEKTCVDLYSANGHLTLEKSKIHATLPFFKKFRLSVDKLDASVPAGKYRGDLSRYWSIQNDFPVVYGIGEDSLAENLSLERKTQALQLKGYLLFYDQLLANYTAQLGNIRALFSLKPEADRSLKEKQTYAAQIPSTVTGIEKLLKCYEKEGQTAPGTELALPVANDDVWQQALQQLQQDGRSALSISNYCGEQNTMLQRFTLSSATVRAIYIRQLTDTFANNAYEVEVLHDRYGYFFVLQPRLPSDLLLVGSQRFKYYDEARNRAGNGAFIASLVGNYSLVTEKSENTDPDKHYFGLNYYPVSYLDFIQKITESEEEYSSRRKQMLDHLLARFGEDFTDYTLLKYRQKVTQDKLTQDTINDQSAYLNEFADLSRNRGKAFDYLQPSWNTANVSGFEKRVAILAGIDNYDRRNLCNIEVMPCFELQLKDEKGNVILKANRGYEGREAFTENAAQLISDLHDPAIYGKLQRNLRSLEPAKIERLFSAKASEEHLVISSYQYRQQLLNSRDEVVATGKNSYRTAESAVGKRDEFILNINDQIVTGDNKKPYRLLYINEREYYLDLNAFGVEITKHPYWKWQLNIPELNEKTSSAQQFSTEEEAWKDALENAKIDTFIEGFEEAISWKVRLNDVVTFSGKGLFREHNSAESAWALVRGLAQNTENYGHEITAETSFRILLYSGNEVVAVSQSIDSQVFDPQATIQVCAKAFLEESLQPEYTDFGRAYGFLIPGKNSFPTLKSHHLYSSRREALTDLQKAYALGISKKAYNTFEDKGKFGFHIQLDAAIILAEPDITYDTDKERDRALNAGLRFFKKEEPPIALSKQPNTYTWSLAGEFNGLVHSDTEFSSNPKARDNFRNALLAKATATNDAIFDAHLYRFTVENLPSRYKFLYGNTTKNAEFQPLFISNSAFSSIEKAKEAYTKFVKQLPQLLFRPNADDNADFDFALYKASAKKPVAVQYQKDSLKASSEEAKTVVDYFRQIYDEQGNLREDFISEQIFVNQEQLFQWKFYKKNEPLAINPYRCRDINNAEAIKKAICDRIPPIDLNDCPPKEIVICPEKDPDKYHYQLCFKDKNGLEFILVSFVGYNSYEEAYKAWEKEWYKLILLAKNPSEYGTAGTISLDENYKQAQDTSCEDASYLAVIPSGTKSKIVEAGIDVVSFYTQMANLFPIYESIKGEKTIFKFKVVVLEQGLVNPSCDLMDGNFPKDGLGSLIWLGTADYSCYTDAVKAYNHFYNLAGISQNCRVRCEKGNYYVSLIEVLVESFCRYTSVNEAWDDAFARMGPNNEPYRHDACGDCLPGGVRSFLYACDDPTNFIPVCIDDQWTFKVIEPDYYLADHACSYNSQAERDQAIKLWEANLQKLNWEEYLNFAQPDDDGSAIKLNAGFMGGFMKAEQEENPIARLCELAFIVRECLGDCSKNLFTREELVATLKKCLLEKYTDDSWAFRLIEVLDKVIEEVIRFADYFPIYASDEGQCYRIYWPDNDKRRSEDGLQPCGCDGLPIEEEKSCGAKYPFVSSLCFDCCEAAVTAFLYLAQTIKNGKYAIECSQKSEYGPYSFQIVDPTKELGYHPQRYDNYQELLDAIQNIQACTGTIGMHLLEHILLRPKDQEDCRQLGGIDNAAGENCLLPICPDYCCPIDWYPDMDKDDPCADGDPDVIHYLPGSDPYSFWATLALPSWAKGFRTPDARNAFEQLLYKEVPALVGLNVLWLGPKEMCQFEDKFRVWLDWLQDPGAAWCDPDGKHPSCHMADCIKNPRIRAGMPHHSQGRWRLQLWAKNRQAVRSLLPATRNLRQPVLGLLPTHRE